MNLITLIALILSCIAVAISVCAAVAVIRLQSRLPRRQHQTSGPHSIQIQPGGITIDETSLGRRDRIARETAKRMAEQGRHL